MSHMSTARTCADSTRLCSSSVTIVWTNITEILIKGRPADCEIFTELSNMQISTLRCLLYFQCLTWASYEAINPQYSEIILVNASFLIAYIPNFISMPAIDLTQEILFPSIPGLGLKQTLLHQAHCKPLYFIDAGYLTYVTRYKTNRCHEAHSI